MEVILAIDLKAGIMVKAYAGFRLNYKPFKSSLYDHQNPCKFIKKVLINDPGMGVIRHADAGYNDAIRNAESWSIDIPK